MRLLYLVVVVSISLMVLNSGLETVAKSNARVANVDSIVDQAVRGK